MKLIPCICLIALIVISCNTRNTNNQPDRNGLNTVCDDIMKSFLNKEYSLAMLSLKRYSVMGAAVDTLEKKVLQQMNELAPAYGSMITYKFLGEKKVSNVIVQRLYLLQFEKYFLKFDFILYNNGKTWRITNFNYNANLGDILY